MVHSVDRHRGEAAEIADDTPLVARPTEPYVGSTELPDDYRCQIIEVPDKDEVVHHSIVFRAEAAQMAAPWSCRPRRPGP